MKHLPFDRLLTLAQRECAAYAERTHTTETARMELFRRAILDRDDAAWTALYRLYHPQLRSWVYRVRGYVVWRDDAAALADGGFLRFWRAMTPERFAAFTQVGTLLRYLQQSVVSEVYDTWRVQRDWTLADAAAVTSSPASSPDALAERADTWNALCALLRGDDERTLVYARFVEQRTPRAVAAAYATMFPTVQAVYTVQHRVFMRLGRHTELQHAWRGDYEKASYE